MKARNLFLLLFVLIPNLVQAQFSPPSDFRKFPSYQIGVRTAYTAVESLINLEAEASRGFVITRVCIHAGTLTTADYIPWDLVITNTASSAGTVIVPDSATTNYLRSSNPFNPTWTGLARTGGTEGNSVATIDGGLLYAPTATALNNGEFCREYCKVNSQCPYIPKGVINGVKLFLTPAAGGADQTARIDFVAIPEP